MNQQGPYFTSFAYLNELKREVANKSGNKSDCNHLGKILIHSLRQDPMRINQIDGYTGESETNESFLKRTTLLAQQLLDLGIQVGDVIAVAGPSTLEITIPIVAGFYIGAPIMPIAHDLILSELQHFLSIGKPKMVFCTNERVEITRNALQNIDLEAQIFTLDKSEEYFEVKQLIAEAQKKNKIFSPVEFDGDEAIALIIPTGGSTGIPKAAASTYATVLHTGANMCTAFSKYPEPFELCLVTSSMNWAATLVFVTNGILYHHTRLHTSIPVKTVEHIFDLINQYKPSWAVLNPSFAAQLVGHPNHLKCDFTCFEKISLAGSACSVELIKKLKALTGGSVMSGYGMTEMHGMTFSNYDEQPPSSCGKQSPHLQYKLIDIESGKEITEPNVTGELLVKGTLFKGYYNDPEETSAAFTEDGWFKTGDMFYKDCDGNYFFTDRIKLMIKYMPHHISPTELESVISTIPGVVDVVVTASVDDNFQELPVACVILAPGAHVTEDQIKNKVKDNLSDAKQLRGGVVFMDSFPLLPSTKVNRIALKKYVNSLLVKKTAE